MASYAGNNGINVSWTAPAFNGDAQDLSYSIYRGMTPGGEAATPIATGVSAPHFLDTGRAPGVTYYYLVTAVDLGGVSAVSGEAYGVDAATWTGAADGINWNVPGNWSDDLVPTLIDSVIIGIGAGTIQVPAGVFTASTLITSTALEIDSGAVFTLHGQSSFNAGMTVDGGGQFVVAPGPVVVVVDGLNIAPGGKVDLAENYLVVRNSQVSTITGPRLVLVTIRVPGPAAESPVPLPGPILRI